MFTVVRKKTPNSFLEVMRKRRSDWSAAGKIAARIVVPPDLRWWYWQEFGTAIGGRTRNVDSTGGASGSTYSIKPLGPGYPLKWPEGMAWNVNHPGVPSHHFVTRTLPDNLKLAAIKIIAAMDRSQWNVATVRDSLLGEVMPRVKENIVQMISITLTGTREDGKLLGQTAADDFDQRANIRNSGS